MKNLLLVNGHDVFDRAQGQLTNHMVDLIKGECPHHFELKETKVVQGYKIKEEVEKFQWADTVIIQTPIYWFSIPGILKKYIDDVFIPEVFFTKANTFGRGGLFSEKEYMLSVSWGASIQAFNGHQDDFLEGYSEDHVLFPIYKTFEYCGFHRLPTFSVYSAMKTPLLHDETIEFQAHLRSHIIKAGRNDAL